MMRWTNNFSDERKIGEGAFGDVFKGILADIVNQRQEHVMMMMSFICSCRNKK